MFFVGNSFTGNDGGLPIHLEHAWPHASLPLHVQTDAQYFWGQGLGAMYTPAVVDAIEGGRFDTCVVTSGTIDEMTRFAALVERHCDHFVVFMTWARNPTISTMREFRDGTAAIVDDLRELERRTSAHVIPSGLVFYDLVATPPRAGLREDWLFFPQNIHQNGAGVAINVYVAYAALVAESPVGIEYELVLPDGAVVVSGERVATRKLEDKKTYAYDELVFDDELRTALQERAWNITAAWFAGNTEFD